MKQNQKKYDTSQGVFYKVCETGWNLCTHYLADFTELKPFYTSAYISKAKEAVKNAELRTASAHTLHNIKEIRISLVKAASQVQHSWQILKLYITKAYPANLLEVKLQAAGSSFYKKASLQNWDSLRNLIKTSEDFMRNEFDMLTANQNMPHTFPAKFIAAAGKFSEIEKVFFDAKINQAPITSYKIDANNIVYDALIQMMKDAQQIFRYQPEIKKQFIFSNIVSVYENKNTSKAHVTASDKNTAPDISNTPEIAIKAEAEQNEMKKVA